jgi:hypothetical protein
MTIPLFWQCFIACLIGNIIHVSFKIRSLSIDYKKANLPFSIGQYFKDDKFALVADAAASFGLVYLADEWLHNEYILGKIKTFFVFIGFTGSYVILQFTSVAKSKFRKIVDEKTNIADGK